MDNISDLIPLVIILGSLIVSIVQASMKKKAQKDVGKTMLPKGVYNESPLEKPVVDFPKAELFKEKRKKKRVTITPVIDNPEIKRTVVATSEESILVESKEESNSLVFDATDTDELKRAVIYSEILNRKEY